MLIYWCSFNWTIVTLCSDEVLKIKQRCYSSTKYIACTNWMEKGISLADTPVIGVVEEKIGTRVNTQTPFTNFSTRKNLQGYTFSLHATHGNRASFLAANSTAKFVRSRGVYLAWTVQRAFWKGSEQEKQWGEGVQSESRRNSYNQKLLPDPSCIPDSGIPHELFILTALVNIRRSINLTGNDSDEIYS